MSNHGFIRNNRMRILKLPSGAHARAALDPYCDPADAPFYVPLRCEAHDSNGPYGLPMRCVRTENGWISATTGTKLHVTITGWRR